MEAFGQAQVYFGQCLNCFSKSLFAIIAATLVTLMLTFTKSIALTTGILLGRPHNYNSSRKQWKIAVRFLAYTDTKSQIRGGARYPYKYNEDIFFYMG